MGIKRLTIKGFKSIRECNLELRPLNILIGANGSGKSNFISIFVLLNAVVNERLQPFSAEAGANTLLYFGSKTTPTLEIELAFGGDKPHLENGYLAILAPNSDENLFFSSESALFHDTQKHLKPFVTSLGSDCM
jgi:predicted ATPase